MHAESLKSQTMLTSLQHTPAVSCTSSPCFTPPAGYLPGSPEAPFFNIFAFLHVLALFLNNMHLMLSFDFIHFRLFCKHPLVNITSSPPL